MKLVLGIISVVMGPSRGYLGGVFRACGLALEGVWSAWYHRYTV